MSVAYETKKNMLGREVVEEFLFQTDILNTFKKTPAFKGKFD